jgi:hypothetical protein
MSIGTAVAVMLVLAAFAATIIERASGSGTGPRVAVRSVMQVALFAISVGIALVRTLHAAADRIDDEQKVPDLRDRSNRASSSR